MRHRVPLRQSGWVLFGALVVVLVVEGIALGFRSAKLHHTGTSPPSPIGAQTTTTVTALPIVQPVTTTTTTTLPGPVSAPATLTYTLPANTRITITAHQACWIEAKTAANGRVLFEQTLRPGERESWRTPVWIRFGNPSVVDAIAESRPIQLPTEGPGDLIVRSP
jgi:hypothetical protein